MDQSWQQACWFTFTLQTQPASFPPSFLPFIFKIFWTNFICRQFQNEVNSCHGKLYKNFRKIFVMENHPQMVEDGSRNVSVCGQKDPKVIVLTTSSKFFCAFYSHFLCNIFFIYLKLYGSKLMGFMWNYLIA